MCSLSKELVFAVLQFLKEENFEDTVHMLEQETGIFFDLEYFERLVMAGLFDRAERYLSGFTDLRAHASSVIMFFEIRKQKYLEALDRKDLTGAVKILRNDLQVFKQYNQEVYVQILDLLMLDDFRELEELRATSRDTKVQRTIVFMNLRKIIQASPLFEGKLTFPSVEKSRLRKLVNQSVNWQHHHCLTPRSNPNIRTILKDHICEPPHGAPIPSPAINRLMGTTSNRVPLTLTPTTYNRLQPGVASAVDSPFRWPENLIHSATPAVASGSFGAGSSAATDGFLKRPRTPPPSKVHQFAESEYTAKRLRSSQNDEVTEPEALVAIPEPIHSLNMCSGNDLPKTVVRNLNQGSNVVSMDFHPRRPAILLVGTKDGDIGIWEVVSCEKLALKSFRVWDASKLKMATQVSLSKDYFVSVNKCIWSPHGKWTGVAFSKNIVHIYQSSDALELKPHLEIDAHTGSVNDIAFTNQNEQLNVITCGDDKAVKVWNTQSGDILHTLEGHEAPVYAIYPHHKSGLGQKVEFILSSSVDGKINAWLYDEPTPTTSFDTPGNGFTTMAYSHEGSRFFSSGTSKGESYLVEWDDNDPKIIRIYSGLGKLSLEPVKFDTTKKLLAAGDDHQIKFWDMDNISILSITDADGGLPARPNLCFNKEGSLLAVTTSHNGIKVLANTDGIQSLQTLENRKVPQESVVTKAPTVNLIDASNPAGHVPDAPENTERVPPQALITSVDGSGLMDSKQRIPEEGANKSKNWQFAEVTDPAQCRSIKLPDPQSTGKIARLHYTNFGGWLLALDTNARHTLWKWQRNDANPSGKATTKFSPELCLPSDKIDMRNDTSDKGPGEAYPCIALTKNDSYASSCSGGKVSLFNLKTLKLMFNFGAPPPAATCLAFNPKDCNMMAIGMEDASIKIFNCRTDKIKAKLKGHGKRITGLAFSEVLNALVSSGADGRLCIWGTNQWEKQKSKSVQSQAGGSASSLVDTEVQFHKDQVHLLVVQDSQIAIYDASKLECLCYWAPQDPMTSPISSATCSCDSLLVYASFCDGSVGVFDAEVLKPRCRIAPSAFMPGLSSGNTFPLVIAAHPLHPNQFAVGLTDGGVHVIEPAESEGKWGVGPSDIGSN